MSSAVKKKPDKPTNSKGVTKKTAEQKKNAKGLLTREEGEDSEDDMLTEEKDREIRKTKAEDERIAASIENVYPAPTTTLPAPPVPPTPPAPPAPPPLPAPLPFPALPAPLPFPAPPAPPPLPAPPAPPGAPPAPEVDLDSFADLTLDPEDEGLFTPEHNRIKTGRSADGQVVAWKKQGYSTQVIVRYGPPNSPKFERSTKTKLGIPFDMGATPEMGPDYRFGDEKRAKKFVRQWNDFKGVLGVAYNCTLHELKPRNVTGEKKYPRVDIYVKWLIDGQVHRVWEVFSSISHIWPNRNQCEEYIYNTAQKHSIDHGLWKNNEREGRDATPTPSPGMNGLMPQGPPEFKVEGDVNQNSEDKMKLYLRRMWAVQQGLDPDKLTMKQELEFMMEYDNLDEL